MHSRKYPLAPPPPVRGRALYLRHRTPNPDQQQSIKTTGLASAPHTRLFYLDQKQNQQGSIAQTYRTAPPGTAGKLIHTRLYHLEVATSGQAASQKPPLPTPESTQRPLLNKTIFSRLGEIAISSHRNKHQRSNKMGKQKNMPQMNE